MPTCGLRGESTVITQSSISAAKPFVSPTNLRVREFILRAPLVNWKQIPLHFMESPIVEHLLNPNPISPMG